MSNINLSIIIVNYKSLNLLRRCLESFEKYPPKTSHEIIIANNDDNIQAFNNFAKNYPEIRFIQNTGNWGFSSGCNLGASIANSEYLLFLNPDTKLTESPAIDKMAEALERDISIGICGCKIVDSKGINKPLYWNNPWFFIKWIKTIHDIVYKNEISKRFDIKKDIWYPDVISGAVLMIRTIDFNKINGWSDDKYWMYSEDRDMSNRVTKQLNKKLVQLRNYDIYHVWGGTSEKNDSLMLNMEMTISRHNYIYYNSYGLSRIIILIFYVLKNLFIPFTKLFLSLLLLNHNRIVKYKYITIQTIKYYLISIKRRTWNSDKLEYEKR